MLTKQLTLAAALGALELKLASSLRWAWLAGVLHTMNQNRRTTVSLALLVLLLCSNLGAAPVTYVYDDTASGGVAGTGTFTLDIGSGLGVYNATGVSGGPGTGMGLWTSVEFSAPENWYAMLFITDTSGFRVPPGGYTVILPTSTGQAEWAKLINQLALSWNIFITEQTPPTPNLPPVCDIGPNQQIASAEQAATIIRATGSDPDSDPLQYRWLEGATVLLDWASVGANGEAPMALGGLPSFAIGNHTLTLEVKDGQVTVSDEMILTVQNSPPEAWAAPSSQVVQIGFDPIVVIADVADFDGDTLSYQCSKGPTVLASGTITPPAGGDRGALPELNIPAGDPRFGLGLHQLELQVSDGFNAPVCAFVFVEVTDSIAPSLGPIPTVTILWPPNHKLVPVIIEANAFDNGGGAVHLEVAVQSSEPADSDRDGNTIPDFYMDSVNDATGVIELRLRSERAGRGPGRTYTILITATDESGNASTAVVEIRAPHDKKKG